MSESARSGTGSRCHCTALRQASRRISQLYDLALAPSGLKVTQRAILARIGRSETTNVGELADALVMDAGGLAHTLKPLIRDGFVTTAPDPQDRRNRLVRLTAAGKAKLKESEALWLTAQRGFEKELGKARSEALHEALGLLIADDFADRFEAAVSRG
ncbi:MarR family winged helix-turn-helix transcriptional regulator [Bradyrhizobium sp. SYSU BS000235]|uniref:MarR family winged helix-turn-helix transcriptional regulator n=1 Tax=Bradyrhizobium sp. SYSU BS000235 TaxID=3411332 RepID=UPI003C7525D8